ncbi:hypothetical protein WJX81_008116 [Elliptochloris bilobata]|uniref:PX domain-containing protein n=1 Tax=Elliptochloris bilobata TaxID=381761 RepID=A0AAW1SCZ4_9CHLO
MEGKVHPGDDGVDGNPFMSTEAPPPPYESVVLKDGDAAEGAGASQQASSTAASDFQIVVTDPHKTGDNVGAYVSYKVQTKTNLPQYKRREFEVIRRYRDFAWLHSRLQEQNRGIIVPPVPEKNAMSKLQMSTEFIEMRRRTLTSFINRVASHPALARSKDLQAFLEASEEDWGLDVARANHASHPALARSKDLQAFLETSEEDWGLEVARANHEAAGGGSAAKRKLASTLQLFRDLGHTTKDMIAGKTVDEDEDSEYLKVRDYMYQLEAHLAEVHRQAQRLIRQQAGLGGALAEFGESMLGLGKFERGPLADGFSNLGAKADSLARASQVQADALGASFEAPLKEFVRLVRSAKAVMADRGAALSALQHAKADMETRRGKLLKMRGVPGIKEEKVSEAERELNEAQRRVEAARAAYESIVQRMSEELVRFQRDRAHEFAAVLRAFAAAQAQLAADSAKAWRALAPVALSAASNGAATR